MKNSKLKVHVEGLGLIGASIALKLNSLGHIVSGNDIDPTVAQLALDRGVVQSSTLSADADLVFVAVPVEASIAVIERCLEVCSGVVTDVGSTKVKIVETISSDNFIGGHPMAGSEIAGLDGADGELFADTTWILTPKPDTLPEIEIQVRDVVTQLGAQVVSIEAEKHDRLIASVSHVPHLVSASLMNLVATSSGNNDLVLRLAAGGFRDMTRISGGSVEIWPEICITNSAEISKGLRNLSSELLDVADMVESGDRSGLTSKLGSARRSRQNLPARYAQISNVAEVQIPIGDSPGQLSRVTKIAAEIGVNIVDIGIEHLSSGDRGVLSLLVDTDQVSEIKQALILAGFTVRVDTFFEEADG